MTSIDNILAESIKVVESLNNLYGLALRTGVTYVHNYTQYGSTKCIYCDIYPLVESRDVRVSPSLGYGSVVHTHEVPLNPILDDKSSAYAEVFSATGKPVITKSKGITSPELTNFIIKGPAYILALVEEINRLRQQAATSL